MNQADYRRIRAIEQEIEDILSSYFEHERISKFDRMRLDDLEAERQRLLPPPSNTKRTEELNR